MTHGKVVAKIAMTLMLVLTQAKKKTEQRKDVWNVEHIISNYLYSDINIHFYLN